MESNEKACSNGRDYPVWWDDETLSGSFLFGSHFDCCKRFFSDPNECAKHYDCVDETGQNDSDKPCISGRYHMTRDFSK